MPKIGAKWGHKSGFTLEKLEIAKDGSVTTETSLVDAAPGLKLEFKGNDKDKGDLLFTYTTPKFTLAGDLDALKFSKIGASISAGHAEFKGGLATSYDLAKSALGSINATVVYTIPKIVVALKATKDFSEFSALASYEAAKDITVAAQANYSKKETTSVLAAIYKCNPKTTIKVKASNAGAISALVKQEVDKAKKFNVVGVAEIPAGFSGLKYAINASLG